MDMIIKSKSSMNSRSWVKRLIGGGLVFAHVLEWMFNSRPGLVSMVRTHRRRHRCADDGHVSLESIALNAIYSVNAISLLIFFLYLLHSLQVIFLFQFSLCKV